MYFMCLVPAVCSSQGVNCRQLWPHAHSIGPKMLPYLHGIAYLSPSMSIPHDCDTEKDKTPDTRKRNEQKGTYLVDCIWYQKGVGSRKAMTVQDTIHEDLWALPLPQISSVPSWCSNVWHCSHPSQTRTISFTSKRNCPACNGEYVLSLFVLSAEGEEKH